MKELLTPSRIKKNNLDNHHGKRHSLEIWTSPGGGHLDRGGEAQYPSGLAPDGEARSQPGATVAGGPSCLQVHRGESRELLPGGLVRPVSPFGRVTHAPADPRAHYRTMMRSTYIRLGLSSTRTPHHRVRLHDLGAQWTLPFHRGYGVGGPRKTTTLMLRLLRLRFRHGGRVCGCSSRSRCWKESKIHVHLFCAHVRWRSRSTKEMRSADPECTQHSGFPK